MVSAEIFTQLAKHQNPTSGINKSHREVNQPKPLHMHQDMLKRQAKFLADNILIFYFLGKICLDILCMYARNGRQFKSNVKT